MAANHNLLMRQLKRLGVEDPKHPPTAQQWPQLLARVSRAYAEADQERYLAARSQEIASREMHDIVTRLAEAQRIAGLGHWSFSNLAHQGQWSEECSRIFGMAPAGPALSYRTLLQQVHRNDRPALKKRIDAALRDGDQFEIEFRLLLAYGETRWVRVLGQPVEDGHGKVSRLHGTAMDVTPSKLAEAALRESEAHFRALVEQASDSFYVHDFEGRFINVNQRGCDCLGYSRAELLTMDLADIDLDLSLKSVKGLLGPLTPGNAIALESRHRRKDGSVFPVEIRVGPIDIDGRRHLLSLVRDVTERTELQDQLRHLAYHDPLTDLPNRAMFNRQLTHALIQGQRYNKGVAVLFIDLDRFKNINDTLGHDAGDRLLQEMARRLTSSLRGGDLVARLGGDEFVVLLEEVTDVGRVSQVARQILTALVKEFPLDGQLIHITASIGISTFPEDGTDEFALMKHADVAMYRAKEGGKNNYQFYSEQMDLRSGAQLALESGLRRALERNELLLHYQPKVETQSGRITGIEALVRWQHPQHGLLAPEHFITLAEETGLIVPLTKWVLREACSQNCAWAAQGLPAMRLAVNLSARLLTDENLLSDVSDTLREVGMDPGLLELEITESMMMHNTDKTLQVLAALQERGIRIAIDDFGSGYSSLSQLKQFPIDIIKIDRSFITDLAGNQVDQAIADAIIAMGKSLNIIVVAEGVEAGEQLQFLRSRDCDEIQGYFFSEPLSAHDFALLLQRNASQH
jgi:diguanylate cyclase (GGDEF)-like protein/PAS domain S-box-containing protein